jgi:hypothetical protein
MRGNPNREIICDGRWGSCTGPCEKWLVCNTEYATHLQIGFHFRSANPSNHLLNELLTADARLVN